MKAHIVTVAVIIAAAFAITLAIQFPAIAMGITVLLILIAFYMTILTAVKMYLNE